MIIENQTGIILAVLLIFVFFLFSWKNLKIGACLILFLSPVYLVKISTLPFNALDVLVWVLVLVWLVKKKGNFNLLAVRFKELGFNFWISSALIFSGVILAVLFSDSPRVSLGILKSWFVEPFVFGLILYDLISSRKQMLAAAGFLAAAGALAALFALACFFKGLTTYDGRLSAMFLSPNHLAMFFEAPLILLAGLFFSLKNSWLKNFVVLAGGITALAFFFTFSYGAWLAVFVSLAFWVWLLGREKIISRKTLVLLAVVFTVSAAAVIFSQAESDKMENLLSLHRSSGQARLVVWRAAVEILKDNWLVGIGPGLFQQYYLAYQKFFPPYPEWAVPQPHNLFLAFWLQAGLLGILGFSWLIAVFLKKLSVFGKQKKEPLVLALMAAVVCILVHGLFDTTYWKNDLALVFWAIIFLGYRAVRLSDW